MAQGKLLYKEILHSSLVAAVDREAGREVYVLPMECADAMSAVTWPKAFSKGGVELPLVNWPKVYHKKLRSSRFQSFGMWNAQGDSLAAAIRMGVAKHGDRISVTHLSRNMGDSVLEGLLARVAYTSLLIAGQAFKMEFKIEPSLAILNPVETALSHYEATAASMSLDTELVRGWSQTLLYIK